MTIFAYDGENERSPQEIEAEHKKALLSRRLKLLYGRAGYECECGCHKILDVEETDVSVIWHIEEMEPDRYNYNPSLTEEEYNDANNLILLCPKHYSDVEYTHRGVVDLKCMKARHEDWIRQRLNGYDGLLFRTKLDEIFSKYRFDDIFSDGTIKHICDIRDDIFWGDFFSKLRGAIDAVNKLRRSDCASNMPDGIQYRLGMFSLWMQTLKNRVELFGKTLIDDDVDRETMDRYIGTSVEKVREAINWLECECNTMCKLYHIAWEKED